MRQAICGAVLTLLISTGISGQSISSQPADASPIFDVASIRLNRSNKPVDMHKGDDIHVSPGSLVMRNVSLKSLVRWAYHVMDYQVSGPDWLNSEHFDLAAKAAGPASEDELRRMLQTLLADRFKLTLHRQTKDQSVYVVVVGKNGPKFHESETEGESSIEPPKQMVLVAQRVPISKLVELLSAVLSTPVIDETGLKGRYDVTINLAKYIPENAGHDAPFDRVSLMMTALQEELGLKLESKKVPLDLLIVDHAEKLPVEN